MAYARFSSDDFQSTIYLYESIYDCYTLHVAGTLFALTNKQKEYLGPPADLAKCVTDEKVLDYHLERDARLRDLLSTSNFQTPFEHPLAGQTIDFDEPGPVADTLEELKAAGAHIPAGVIEILHEEQAELDNE